MAGLLEVKPVHGWCKSVDERLWSRGLLKYFQSHHVLVTFVELGKVSSRNRHRKEGKGSFLSCLSLVLQHKGEKHSVGFSSRVLVN